MSPGPDGVCLSGSDLDGPLPWSVLVDRDLRLAHIGSSLAHHCDAEVGAEFGCCLSLERPDVEIATFADLKALAGLIVVMSVPGLAVPLRGAVFLVANGDLALIAAVPLLKSQDELAESQLTLSDFAPQDSLPDLLFAMQARDVSIRETSESCSRQAEATNRLKSILDSALDAMITFDDQGRVVEFNTVACDMFGTEREDAVGRLLQELITFPAAWTSQMDRVKRSRVGGKDGALAPPIELTACRPDGDRFPIAAAIIPFEHEGSRYFTATLRDLTEKKAAETALAGAAEQEHLLRRELDHRVKNMLTQILVLCRQAEANATSDAALLESLRHRIRSFSDAHDLLSRKRVTGIAMDELARRCVRPYVEQIREDVSLDGPACLVRPKAAMTFAMVLNELATNAAKHGAAAHGGSIHVGWSVDGERFTLTWRERHEGDVPADLDGGLGAQVLRAAIPYELGGEATLINCGGGVCFEASAPLERILV